MTARASTYPDIRLVYWAGGNPFHHHQDLGAAAARLLPPRYGDRARVRPGPRPRATPTSSCRRRSPWSATTSAPPPATRCWWRCTAPSPPYGEARDDHAIFAGLAERLGFADAFTEGRSPRQWLEHIYEPTRRALGRARHQRAGFRAILGGRRIARCRPSRGTAARSARFRRDPEAAPLPTPSGKIEIASADDRRLRLRRLPRPPGLAAAGEGAGSPAGAALPAAADRQPAGDAAAQPARFRRHQPRLEDRRAASRCASTRTTPRRAASPTATSCGSTTIAAPASPARC